VYLYDLSGVYIWVIINVCVIVSSPYLLVFGDDRVHSTWEQIMLQVDLVRHRAGAGLVLGEKLLS